MRELNIDEIKVLLLQNMDYINDLCKKHNIQYSLCGGTLLGAIRHQGFIPWDDDIDIMMTRDNYARFLNLFEDKTGRYKIVSWEKDTFPGAWAKVYDMFTKLDNTNYFLSVDIFPMDWCGNFKLLAQFYMWLSKQQKRILDYASLESENDVAPGYKLLRTWLYRYAKRKGYERCKEERNRFLEILKAKHKTKYMASFCLSHTIFKASLFDEIILANFEGRKYPIIKEYDSMLTTAYGDYMTLPPENERIPTHINHCYLTRDVEI